MNKQLEELLQAACSVQVVSLVAQPMASTGGTTDS